MKEIIEVGKYKFHRTNIAFHFIRDNVYSPWECIGVYASSYKGCLCRYDDEHKGIEYDFKSELKSVDNEYIKNSPEFIKIWGKKLFNTNSVVSPVIAYYTSRKGPVKEIMDLLYVTYVGTCSIPKYLMLTIMLRMKDAYFAMIMDDRRDNSKAISLLQKEGLIWMKNR